MRWSEAVFFLLGIWLVVAPDAWGWSAACGLVGEGRLVRFLLGVCVILAASLIVEKNRMREHMRGLLDALNRMLYGKDYAREREAVDLLLRAAASRSEEVRKNAVRSLEQVTGESFGDDVDAWRDWWSRHRATFSMGKSRRDPQDGV